MEGLRGLAVFLVFLVHYSTLVQPWSGVDGFGPGLLHTAHTIGNAGVDLFFVLSGYLIYGSLIAGHQRFSRYVMRRLRRIYPTFLAVFAIYIALSQVFPNENKIPRGAVDAAVYLSQNLLLLPGLFPIEPLITVAWSLSYEMFYYLAMPLLIVVLSLRTRSAAWRIRFFVLLAGVSLLVFSLVGGHVRLVMFVAGVLLFDVLQTRGDSAPGSAVALAALVASLAATLLPGAGPAAQALRTAVLSVGFFVLCFTCFAEPQAAIARAFCWTPARWLGNMSYSYYLIHGLTLKAIFIVLAKLLPPGNAVDGLAAWMFVPAFGLTLLPAAALYLWVERPVSLQPSRRSLSPPAAAAATERS